MSTLRYENITVDVDGHPYGGQYVTRNDEVFVFYGGAMCARQAYSPEVTARSIASESIRTEVRRRLRSSLLHHTAT